MFPTVKGGDNVMPRTRVFEWHNRFMESREEVENDERSGRPSISITEENDQKYYLEVLTKLRERVRKKRPEL